MSLIIPLQQIPNQEVSVEIDGINYTIQLKYVKGIMVANISADGDSVCNGALCYPQQKLIPYNYMTKGGNFIWACQDDEYPDYTKFGELHNLLYLTDDELAEL